MGGGSCVTPHPTPPPLCRGKGSKKFSMLVKRGELALYFLGEGALSKKGGLDLFRRGGAKDFLKVIFNC